MAGRARKETAISGLPNRFWWERSDLGYQNGRLFLADTDLEGLVRAAGTPVFVYSVARMLSNLKRLTRALSRLPFPTRVFYALKANRFQPLLTCLKLNGLAGMDVCSPGELLLARQIGFREEEISYTATSVADDDLDLLARHPAVWCNCDSLSVIRRLGERCPGREVGLRINPGIGIGYQNNQLLEYAGSRPSKFGIYRARMEEALELAHRYHLRVTGIHFHCGCGYANAQLPVLDRILAESQSFLATVPELRRVNIGGGLGVPLTEPDQVIDLDAWADLLIRHLGGLGLEVWVEPGNFLVKDAGILLLQVNTVEEKEATCFIGVNGGFDLVMEPVHYRLPQEIIPVRWHQDVPLSRVTVAGYINEALDILAEDIELPKVSEGDYLALLNTGAYGSSMSSRHCMRGRFQEYLLL